MKRINTPIKKNDIINIRVGDTLFISGDIFAGRDAALPKLIKAIDSGDASAQGLDLEGGVVFHTAVSGAGVGPTSSNKVEIEGSILRLSELGIKIHMGKGKLKQETAEELYTNNSIFVVIPPVTALLQSKILNKKVIAFPEEGMEALYRLSVIDFPVIVTIANGESLYDRRSL
jgi:fumarate hydratase subunit beta